MATPELKKLVWWCESICPTYHTCSGDKAHYEMTNELPSPISPAFPLFWFPFPTHGCPTGARREPHSSTAQPVGGTGSVHGGGPGRIFRRAAPHHAGGRAAQTTQQWQLFRGRAEIQAGETDGSSQHGEKDVEDGGMNGGRAGQDEWSERERERHGPRSASLYKIIQDLSLNTGYTSDANPLGLALSIVIS